MFYTGCYYNGFAIKAAACGDNFFCLAVIFYSGYFFGLDVCAVRDYLLYKLLSKLISAELH